MLPINKKAVLAATNTVNQKSLLEKHITFEIKKQRKPRVSWHAVGKGIKRYTSMKI